jgi:acyl-CoA thioesterase FadM
MPREAVFTEPVVTTQFGPHQLRPRTILGLVATGLGRWLAEYLVPFPRLIDEHLTAVVVRTARIDYADPDLRFGDSEWLTVRTRLGTSDTGEWLDLQLDYEADGRPAASARLILRVLTLSGDESLAAQPGALPDVLRAEFADDEILPEDELHRLARTREPFEIGEDLLSPREWETTLCRSQCEVADQWSFIEMVELATFARERLFTSDEAPPDAVLHAVRLPVRSLVASFRRPMFVFDPCRIVTSAHRAADDHALFQHEVGRPLDRQSCLRVWELLAVA